MQIKKLHIIGFGNINNAELILDKQFNLIQGSNEYGKTTIFAFIRAMIFGLKGTKREIANDYERYLPLENPHNYRGEMYLNIKNQNLKISRNFHRDTRSCEIINTDTLVKIKEKDFLDMLLPIDFETFTNTCYINSKTADPGTVFMNTLQERIINMAQTNSSDILVNNTINNLNLESRKIKNEIKKLPNLNEFILIKKRNDIEKYIDELKQQTIENNKKFSYNLMAFSIIIFFVINILALVFSRYIFSFILVVISYVILFSGIIYSSLKIIKNNKLFYAKTNHINGQIEELTNNLTKINNDIELSKEYYTKEKELKNKLLSIQLAKDSINDIAKSIYSNNTNELNTQLSYIFSKITDDSFKGVFINEEMKIYGVKHNGSLLEMIHFSHGTLEQLYLSLRLVGINMIYKNINLPIILDDAFVHYDYKRYKNTLELLEKSNHQVIVFNLSKSVF